MYMEAYGNVGSVAEGIIKKAAGTYFGKKIAKETINESKNPFEGEPQMNENATSESGVSPSEGVGSKANPDTKMEMEAVSRQKAMESLNSKIENLQGRNIYLQELADSRQAQIDKMNKDIGDVNIMLKGMVK